MALRRVLRARIAYVGAATLAALAVAIEPATASAASEALIGSGSGLTGPTGVARASDGSLWVADDVNGICRLDASADPVTVPSPYCGIEHEGPDAATGLVFDPVTSSFFSGDIASASGAVWRLHLDVMTGEIDQATVVARPAGDRVTAVGLLPSTVPDTAADVVYATKGSTAVMRIGGLGATTPPTRTTVGHSAEPGAEGIAALGDALFLIDGVDVTRLPLTAGARATPVPGLANGIPSALAADPQRGRLYAGTANGPADEVTAFETAGATISPYERGFSGVSAMSVEADGSLLVVDDPGAAAGVLDAAGHGRVWRVPLHSLNRPSARIDAAPPGVTATSAVSFSFSASASSAFECRLDSAPWVTCGTDGAGQVDYSGLADGVHAFEVRAVEPEPVGAGRPARRVFVVDTLAPRVRIAAPASGAVHHGVPVSLQLVADEPGVDYTCSLDQGPWEICDDDLVLAGLPLGSHELRVSGTDLAGNVSDPEDAAATWSFEVVRAPVAVRPAPDPVVTAPEPAAPAPAPQPERPAPPRAQVAVKPEPRLARPAFTLTGRLAARPPHGHRPRLVVMLPSIPQAARTAELTLRSGARVIARRRVPVRPSASLVALELTRSEGRRLRQGPHRLELVLIDRQGRRSPAAGRRVSVR